MLSSNLCRCTGYQNIIKAVRAAAAEMRAECDEPRRDSIGRSVPRLEDRPLLTGQGRFAADVSFPGQLHMRVVRSPVAHGRIVAIDTAAALRAAGRASRCGPPPTSPTFRRSISA